MEFGYRDNVTEGRLHNDKVNLRQGNLSTLKSTNPTTTLYGGSCHHHCSHEADFGHQPIMQTDVKIHRMESQDDGMEITLKEILLNEETSEDDSITDDRIDV